MSSQKSGIPYDTEEKKKAAHHINKLIDFYLNWHEDNFLNKDFYIYLEAIFKLLDEKIQNGEATTEQTKFLVETLLEAKNYRISGLGYSGVKDPSKDSTLG